MGRLTSVLLYGEVSCLPEQASKKRPGSFALYRRMGFKKVTEFDVYIIGLSGPIRRTDGYCRNDVARLSRLSCNPSKAVWITNRESRQNVSHIGSLALSK